MLPNPTALACAKPSSANSVFWSQALLAHKVLKPFINTDSPKKHASPLSFYPGESQRLNITLILKIVTRNLMSQSE